MTRVLRAVARFGVAVLLAAALGPAALLLHMASDHHVEGDAELMTALFHGHKHAPGTPDHDHLAARVGAVSRAETSIPSLTAILTADKPVHVLVRRQAVPIESPLITGSPPTVDTVVLRI